MDKTSSSLPPIILLQFLHMAFPQFAEKGDQGQYLQQVSICWVHVIVACSCPRLHLFVFFLNYFFIFLGCQWVLAPDDEGASAKVGTTWACDSHGGKPLLLWNGGRAINNINLSYNLISLHMVQLCFVDSAMHIKSVSVCLLSLLRLSQQVELPLRLQRRTLLTSISV